MAKFMIDIDNDENDNETVVAKKERPEKFSGYQPRERKRGLNKILGVSALILLGIFLIAAVIGYFYWQNVKLQPSYSLALLVDAAQRGDQKMIEQLLDTDAVIDDFVPQVVEKVKELYGKGLTSTDILKIEQQALPYLPEVKSAAREQVPSLIREKTKPFEKFPIWAIALGAGQYLEIRTEGERVFVKNNMPDRQIELTMRRKGALWQIVAVKDDNLARRFAEKFGQEIINRAKKKTIDKIEEGVENVNPNSNKNFDSLKEKIEDLFR